MSDDLRSSYVLGFEDLKMARTVAEALARQLRLLPIIGRLDDADNPHSTPVYLVSFQDAVAVPMALALVPLDKKGKNFDSGIIVAHAPESPQGME